MPGHGVTLAESTRTWLYIGLNSFGGPAGQISVMHREVVDSKNWISERRFLHALNYCMILPGPEAQQLATYLGWLMHGVRGGLIAGSLFILPGFIVMLGVSAGYALYGEVTWVRGLLFGLQAAVVAIIIQALIRIGRRTLRTRFLVIVAAISFICIALFAIPFPFVVIVAGAVGWLIGRVKPTWLPRTGGGSDDVGGKTGALLPDDEPIPTGAARRAVRAGIVCAVLWLVPVGALILTLGMQNVFAQEASLFSTSALVTFGGAYAVLGYITQEAVTRYGWITPQDMTTGLGLAESTPGPLILVVQFVGFLAAYNSPGSLPPLVAGTLGAILAVWVTFVPCFMFIFLGAPYVERLRHNATISHALTVVGAAVAGVVLDLAVWFALHTAFSDVPERTYGPFTVAVPDISTINVASVGISIVAAVLVFRLRLGTLKVLAVCAGLGAVVALIGWS
jgi:chromate transporter